jgi:hypothetical protein
MKLKTDKSRHQWWFTIKLFFFHLDYYWSACVISKRTCPNTNIQIIFHDEVYFFSFKNKINIFFLNDVHTKEGWMPIRSNKYFKLPINASWVNGWPVRNKKNWELGWLLLRKSAKVFKAWTGHEIVPFLNIRTSILEENLSENSHRAPQITAAITIGIFQRVQ